MSVERKLAIDLKNYVYDILGEDILGPAMNSIFNYTSYFTRHRHLYRYQDLIRDMVFPIQESIEIKMPSYHEKTFSR